MNSKKLKNEKLYSEPKLTVTCFEITDILTLSGETDSYTNDVDIEFNELWK